MITPFLVRQLRRLTMNPPQTPGLSSAESMSNSFSSMAMSEESEKKSTAVVPEQASATLLTPGMSPPTKSLPAKKVSRKVELKPGHSLTHWINRTKTGEDMTDRVGQSETRVITLAELAKHSTETDCWMAIRGKVYNITKYLDYHPGGVDILLKEGGKEATAIFDKTHRWVNIDRLLASCQIGVLKTMTLAI